jgi:hypothetical protein
VLNLASNNLGKNVLAAGWRSRDAWVGPEGQAPPAGWRSRGPWVGPEGQAQQENPGKPEGIIAIADAIPDMRALTKLDVSENNLHVDGGKALAAGIKGNQVITELNIAGNALGTESEYPHNSDMSGVTALADAIPDMGALTSLNLSSNTLCVGGAKIVADAIKVTNYAIAVVFALVSCPSDYWLNCCCLLLSTG